MSQVEDELVGVPGLVVEPYAGGAVGVERRSKRVTYTVEGGQQSIHRLLKEMRVESGLSLRALAERMGIQRASLNQYFWQRRNGGSSRLSWFLRFAEACGCNVWLSFPSQAEQVELKTKHYKPAGNPVLRAKKAGREAHR